MGDYNEFEWEGLKVSVLPDGVRGKVPGLRMFLRKWPFFTGTRPSFDVSLTAQTEEARDYSGALKLRFTGPDNKTEVLVADEFSGLGAPHVVRVTAPWIADQGQHSFDIELSLSGPNTKRVRRPIATFDVKSSESFFLFLFAIFASVASSIIIFCGAIGGGFLVGQLLKEEPTCQTAQAAFVPFPNPPVAKAQSASRALPDSNQR